MENFNIIFVIFYMFLLTACFTISEQGRNSNDIGYRLIKNEKNDYWLYYCGEKGRDYDEMALLWHKQAIEICESYNYYSKLAAESTDPMTAYGFTPSFISMPENMIPYIQGRLRCNENRPDRYRKKY